VRNLIKLFLLLFFISVGLRVQAEVGKLYELDFKENQTFYVYADAKATIRLKGIPSDVDVIQALISPDSTGNFRANLIGKRSKTIEHSSGIANYVDFGIEVLPELSARANKDPIKLKLKSFKKLESGSYEVVSDTNNYIRTKVCSGNDPSCGLIKVKCRAHSTNCVDGLEEVLTTYPNQCEVEKAGAQFVRIGACE
jgi:hypothetical protein